MTHQGFAGSVGTSALLIGAALTILLVVGAVIAFEGFPGPSGEGPSETLLLDGSSATAARPDPQLVLDATTAAARGDAGAGGGSASGSRGFFSPAAPGVSPATPTVPLDAGPSSPLDGTDPLAPSGPGLDPDADDGGGGGQPVDQLSDGVRETSRTLDQAIDGVLPDGELDGVLPDRELDIGPGTTEPLVGGFGRTIDGVQARLGG